MISYKDKLLFLSFQKILTFYLSIIEDELNEEFHSILTYKDNISANLSLADQKFAHRLYDDMLFQNKQFKCLIQNMYFELDTFHLSDNFTLSITSDNNITEIALSHIKKIESFLKIN